MSKGEADPGQPLFLTPHVKNNGLQNRYTDRSISDCNLLMYHFCIISSILVVSNTVTCSISGFAANIMFQIFTVAKSLAWPDSIFA